MPHLPTASVREAKSRPASTAPAPRADGLSAAALPGGGEATDPWGRASYIIDETECRGYVLDACTGRVKAVLHGGGSVVIGEPLCQGCDAPLADGPCGCVTPARRAA
jgi:hypothetical protein